jgi:hypothetical protein
MRLVRADQRETNEPCEIIYNSRHLAYEFHSEKLVVASLDNLLPRTRSSAILWHYLFAGPSRRD